MPTRAEKPTTDEIAAAVEALGDEQLTALCAEWMDLTEAQSEVETELFTRITQLTGAVDEEGDDGEADGDEEDPADGDEAAEEDDAEDDEEDEEQDEAA